MTVGRSAIFITSPDRDVFGTIWKGDARHRPYEIPAAGMGWHLSWYISLGSPGTGDSLPECD